MACFRTANEEGETNAEQCENCHAGREETEDRVQRGATGQVEERIRRESISHGEKEAAALEGPGIERGADQDLVPEQESENQESQRTEKSPGTPADGPRSLQSLDGARGRGWRGNRDWKQSFALTMKNEKVERREKFHFSFFFLAGVDQPA